MNTVHTESDSFEALSHGGAELTQRLKGSKPPSRGAYILHIRVARALKLEVGALGMASFPAGQYAYAGSARSGIPSRVSRHRRLAKQKRGKIHWHIDYLLIHPGVHWVGSMALADRAECEISAKLASLEGVTIPVPGFGASDCRAGCKAHLYLLSKSYPKGKGSETLRLP